MNTEAREKLANAKWLALKNGPVLAWEKSEKKVDRNRAEKCYKLDSQLWQVRSRHMILLLQVSYS